MVTWADGTTTTPDIGFTQEDEHTWLIGIEKSSQYT